MNKKAQRTESAGKDALTAARPRRFFSLFLFLAFLSPLCCQAEELTLEWLGQACVQLTTPDGIRVLMDPMSAATGYTPQPRPVDVVTISHEHADHTNLSLAQGAFTVLRGLGPGGKEWNHIELEIGDARIFNVASYHDKERGAQRGLNSIFIVELPNAKIAHLGDLGNKLDEGQIESLRGTDILLIPVGGHFTINAGEADEIVNQIQPRYVVIPMHYKTPAVKIKELAPVDTFLRGKNVVRVDGNSYIYDTAKPPTTRSYIVLNSR